jgi:hypothetical protein
MSVGCGTMRSMTDEPPGAATVTDRAIGAAADFYRIRIARIDASDELDLDWRDDILYRTPADAAPGDTVTYRVEAVDVDDPERAWVIAQCADRESAAVQAALAEEDLAEMTRSAFDTKWIGSTSA